MGESSGSSMWMCGSWLPRVLATAATILALFSLASAEAVLNELTVGPPMINSDGTATVSDEGCGSNTHVERKFAGASDAGVGYIMLEGYIRPDFWCAGGVGIEEFSAETHWEHAGITCVNPGSYSVSVSGTLTGMIGTIGEFLSSAATNYIYVYLDLDVIDASNSVVYSNKKKIWSVIEIDPLGWNHHWEFDHGAVDWTFTGVNLGAGEYKCRARLSVEMRIATKYIYSLLQPAEVWGVVQFAPPLWSPYGPWTWVDDAGFQLNSITVADDTPDYDPPVTSITVTDPTFACGKLITLTATDNSGGYGVGTIKCRIGNGAWFDYTGPFVAPYSTQIKYYAVDILGNEEDTVTYTTDPPYQLNPPVVTCTPGINYIDVAWTSVPPIFAHFAMNYRIYRDGGLVAVTPNLSWRDENPGTAQHCYTVIADNACAASPLSVPVCAQVPYIALIGGGINGNAVSGGILEMSTYTDVALNGLLTLEVNNIFDPINIAPMVFVWGWGEHATSWSLVSANVPQDKSFHHIPIDMTAPAAPGDYYLSAAFGLEFGGAEVASLTNWQVPGAPHWDDGHDMADWGAAEYGQAVTGHQVLTLYEGPGGWLDNIMPAAMVKITVLPRGAVIGNIYETSGMPANGVQVELRQGGAPVAATATDAAGDFAFPDLIPGDYSVSILTPLGYLVDTDEKDAAVASGDTTVVDFLLTRRDITASQQGIGYWKHQANEVVNDAAATDLLDSMCLYMNRIHHHFNLNPINPITAFTIDPSLSCLENLEILTGSLTLPVHSEPSVGDIDDIGAPGTIFKDKPDGTSYTMCDRAIQQFIALLLNVVADKLAQFDDVSDDGITVSQAITYCNILITDPNAHPRYTISGDPIDPDSPGIDQTHELAKDIAEWINLGNVIPSGIIPATTPDIAYREGDNAALGSIRYRLEQNFPNPFNPRTSISFTISDAAAVTIEIFDVAGRKITTLIDAYLESGEHRVEWDGTDASGAPAASGIYLYRMRADGMSQSRKMLLIK